MQRIRATIRIMLLVLAIAGPALAGAPTILANEQLQDVARRVRPGYDIHVTEHFILLHQNDDPWARQLGQALEAAHDAFYSALSAADFTLEPLERRLIWICFDEQRQFNEYALEADRVDMSWLDGYYSALTNRVAVVRPQFWHKVPADREASGQDALVLASAQVSPNVSADPAGAEADIRRATHEAGHQLAFNSGLQVRGVMYPLWVSEGLATNIEADAPERMGLADENTVRRRQLNRTSRRGGIYPLRQLVTMVRVPSGGGREALDAYAQAWGLFRFLLTEHPEGLRYYMRRTAAARRGGRSEHELLADFEAAFGPVYQIEPQWRAFIDRGRDASSDF